MLGATDVETEHEVPEISNIMCLPCQSNRAGAEHVHPTSPSQDALGCFKSRVPLPQNEHSLVPVVFRVSGDGLIPLNQVRTYKLHLLRNPQTCGYQQNAEGGGGTI